MFRRLAALVIVFALCSGLFTNSFAAENSKSNIELDGKKLETMATVTDDGVMVPLRSISEAAGFKVQWSGVDKSITVSKPGKTIVLKLDDYNITMNDHETNMSAAPQIINGSTYVPSEFVTDGLGLAAKWDKDNEKLTLKSVKENSVIVNTKKEISDDGTLSLNIQYPELQGLDNLEVQNKINSFFAKAASDAKAEGISNEKELSEDEIARQVKVEEDLNYTTEYNQDGILSVTVLDFQYSGGAHGLTIQSSVTFDLKTGEEYKLKDLFKDNTDYVSLVSGEIKKQMDEKGLTQSLLLPFDAIKSDQDFYINNGALVIYFQEDDCFPYVFGIQEFPIEPSSLKDSMKLIL